MPASVIEHPALACAVEDRWTGGFENNGPLRGKSGIKEGEVALLQTKAQ